MRNIKQGHFWQRMNTTCTKCDGTGVIINSTCPVCHGQKVVLKQITKTINIPAGAPDKFSVTLPEEGDQYPDLKPGHVHIGLRVNENTLFTRKDHDLVYNANITLFEALVREPLLCGMIAAFSLCSDFGICHSLVSQ